MKKLIKKTETKPLNAIGEANLINGDFWIIDGDTDTIISLLTEIKDLLKKEPVV